MDRAEALRELHEHPDELVYLWKAIIAFEGFTFETVGRGQKHTGAVRFRYRISRNMGASRRRYTGQAVEDYGNELWIYLERNLSEVAKDTSGADVTMAVGKYDVPKAKSVSRSTVDLAYRNAQNIQAREGKVSGPRKLGVPGSRSYLYAMFLKFGILC